ncbi:MAG: SLC13 family permease [Woeseiaceae bacterium]
MSDSTFVFCLVGAAAILMASNRVRFDVIALSVVLALILSEVLTVPAALSGFGSSIVVVIAGLLVVGDMLDRTGVARAVGDWILSRSGKSEVQVLALVMVSAGILGSVMSSTAVVAIFIPIVLRIAAETGIAASRILIPMSYAALISGMMTLIASSPNVVVSGELVSDGFDGLGFFSFTVIGLTVLVVAIAYMLLLGRHLLGSQSDDRSGGLHNRTIMELWLQYRVDDLVAVVEVPSTSPLAGLEYGEAAIDEDFGVRVLYRVRRDHLGPEKITMASAGMELEPRDRLLIAGQQEPIDRFIQDKKLIRLPSYEKMIQRWMWEMGAAEVLVHPDSTIVGSTAVESDFVNRYGLIAIGLRRRGSTIPDFEDTKLEPGDGMLLIGPWSRIESLQAEHHDFVVTEMPPERRDVVEAYHKAPVALAIVGAMVLLSVFEVVPLVVSVLGAAMAAVLTGCLSAEQAYRAIRWSSLVLIAGMLPLADALQLTGGSEIVVDLLLDAFGNAGPNVMFVALFALTAILGMVLSNVASAVLVVPIAITAANTLQVSPYPFAVAVLIAASAAYSTPVSTPVVALVVEPGKYRFADFLKVGVPLLILTGLVTVLVTPLVFPY